MKQPGTERLSPLAAEVLAFMRRNDMVCPGDGILAGVSGGADSTALILLLREIQSRAGITLRAVHVHHGLRDDEADRDEDSAVRLCGMLGVPCETVRAKVRLEAAENGTGLEEAGRNARYRIFREIAGRWQRESHIRVRIAVAHHQEDQAETILLHLLRGAGLTGLGGMEPVRGDIIRPLLETSRTELRDYLRTRHADWCEDSSNGDLDFARNYVRHVLIRGSVLHVNSGAAAHIARAGQTAREAEDYLRREARRLWDAGASGERPGSAGGPALFAQRPTDREIRLSVSFLRKQPHIMQIYLLREALSRLDLSNRDTGRLSLDAALALTEGQTGRQVMLHGALARREYDALVLCRSGKDGDKPVYPAAESDWTGTAAASGGDIFPDNIGQARDRLRLRVLSREKIRDFPPLPYTKWFDYDKIKRPLSVRNRQPGDYLMAAPQVKKTIRRYMIDEKIPAGLRGQIPLLAEGSHILWVIGWRISEYYKVTDSTRQVLEVIYEEREDGRQDQSSADGGRG